MSDRKWVNTEPGVLVLTGTDFRIWYDPVSDAQKPYRLLQAQRPICRSYSIAHLKIVAQDRQAELEEIGVR